MSQGIGPITVAVGVMTTIPTGPRTGTSQVVLYNESQNLLKVSGGRYNGYQIPAWTGDLLDFSSDSSYSGSISVTPIDISNLSNPPSTVVGGNIYSPGEPVVGTYPVALVRQTSVGGGTLIAASSVTNDGNSAQVFVEGTVATNSSGFSNVAISNDGTTIIRAIDDSSSPNGLFAVTPGTISTPAALAIGSSNANVQISAGAGTLTLNSGNPLSTTLSDVQINAGIRIEVQAAQTSVLQLLALLNLVGGEKSWTYSYDNSSKNTFILNSDQTIRSATFTPAGIILGDHNTSSTIKHFLFGQGGSDGSGNLTVTHSFGVTPTTAIGCSSGAGTVSVTSLSSSTAVFHNTTASGGIYYLLLG